jgi:hypothetical protein
MKLQKLPVIGFLLVISVAVATAQNVLPNPNDDSCSSSLDPACLPAPGVQRRVEQQQTWKNATVRQDKNKDTQRGTEDSAQALSYLKKFGSVTVLSGHIHQTMRKVEGNLTFHTAMSTAFPSL